MAWFECTGGSNGGGGVTLPKIVSLAVGNREYDASISYTFTEAGTFQFYACVKSGDAQVTVDDIIVQLNGTTLTTQTYNGGSSSVPYAIRYGEITVAANDVLTVLRSGSNWYCSGYHLFVLKDADISAFDFLGFVSNDGTTFDIVNDGVSLEVYYQGYYRGGRNCRGHLIVGNESPCIVYNSGSDFWYGGTYAIKIL